MARRFKKKAGLGVVCLPGLPGIGNDTIVEGDEYARFCPAVLEEVFDVVASPKLASKPEAMTAVAKVTSPLPPPHEELEDDDEEVEPPNMTWRKDELAEYAAGLGLDVSGMTKAQILEAIEEEEGE